MTTFEEQPTNQSTALYTNACGCLNGGTCVDIEEQVCECLSAFEGKRCEETYIDFSQAKDQSQGVNPELIVGISVAALMVTIMVVTGYAVWRKCTKLKEKRRWVKWQESRSQSKATIEGFTIVEPTPDPTKSEDIKFNFKLIDSIRKGSVFSIKNEKNESSNNMNRKSSANEIEWIRTVPYGSLNKTANHPELTYSNSQPIHYIRTGYNTNPSKMRAFSLSEYIHPNKMTPPSFPATIEDV